MISKLEFIMDCIDEASAMIVLKEPEDLIYDKLHKATTAVEELLNDYISEQSAKVS